jgi:hypothetical protein
MPVLQLHPEHVVGKLFSDGTLDLDTIISLHKHLRMKDSGNDPYNKYFEQSSTNWSLQHHFSGNTSVDQFRRLQPINFKN